MLPFFLDRPRRGYECHTAVGCTDQGGDDRTFVDAIEKSSKAIRFLQGGWDVLATTRPCTHHARHSSCIQAKAVNAGVSRGVIAPYHAPMRRPTPDTFCPSRIMVPISCADFETGCS